MLEELEHREVKLRVIGTPETNERVLGDVFATKILALIRGMKAADKAANGGKRFQYVITDLRASSASATLAEQVVSKSSVYRSAVEAFGECVAAINEGRYAAAREYGVCVNHVWNLALRAEETFDRAELTFNGFKPVILDRMFLDRANEAREALKPKSRQTRYRGFAIGTFYGQILEADLRGDVAKVILRLTAGGIDVDCVCPGLTGEDISHILEKHVRLSGNAYYDGDSGVPRRIEVTQVPKLTKLNADFTKWEGAFRDFHADEWDEGH